MQQDKGWEMLCDKLASSGYSALSERERVWFNIRALIDAVEGGGIISYFYNSGANTLGDCTAALERLGASDVKRQIDRVSALFPGSVPTSVADRNVIVDSWDEAGEAADKILEEVDDVLMPMMEDLEEELARFLERSEPRT